MKKASAQFPPLSVREREMLRCLMSGKSTKDIAAILEVSERTIKFHIDNIMKKLDAENRTHAVAIVLGEKLMKID